jgi:broad specificity phosphatase PhoE
MRIIAVRHGQTTDNAKQIMRGHGHGKLSSIGMKQAKALGRALKKEKFDFIYCSDLKRCKETLKAVSKFHKHVPVIFTEDLRERNVGIMEGRTYEVARLHREKYKGPKLHYKPKGAESLIELRQRVSKFLKYLKQNHDKNRLLLVTSAGIVRMINHILTKTSLVKTVGKYKFENTSISEYEIKGSKVKVLRFNDSKHL